jgi:hypothetical protein
MQNQCEYQMTARRQVQMKSVVHAPQARDAARSALNAFACALSCVSALILCGCGGGSDAKEDAASTADVQDRGHEEAEAAAFTPWAGAGIGAFELAVLEQQADIRTYLTEDIRALPMRALRSLPDAPSRELSRYEMDLPHATRPPMPGALQRLTASYLDRPSDKHLATFLSLVYLNRSLLNPRAGLLPGAAFKHTLMAQYFLRRARQLGANSPWIAMQIRNTQQAIDGVLARQTTITSEEDHPAHVFYLQTFNYKEENRYLALDQLLEDFYEHPKNAYTAFTINAMNLWIGGEGDKDDPTVLENFVLGSFFSLHAIELARQIETTWLAKPDGLPRFRMASILGGFSALHRRWLLQVHGDKEAIAALDDEHREWRLIHRAFHSFTVGLAFFGEPEHFQEGKAAWEDAFVHCATSTVRTCSNLPRFTHNFSTFVLSYVDFLLKNGDIDTARFFLSSRFVPDRIPGMALYPQWTLGRDAWVHRERHADQIAALYADADPNNDPSHLLLRHRKWGGPTSTCQSCHQAQAKTWTPQEQLTLGATLPPPAEATVGIWPEVSTTWYGTRVQIDAIP